MQFSAKRNGIAFVAVKQITHLSCFAERKLPAKSEVSFARMELFCYNTQNKKFVIQ